MAISGQIKNKNHKRYKFTFCVEQSVKIEKLAVSSSTAGYCQLILFLQFLHFLFRNTKLKRGILSCHEITLLQYGQRERPHKVWFLGSRIIKTLIKEPKRRPKTADKMKIGWFIEMYCFVGLWPPRNHGASQLVKK